MQPAEAAEGSGAATPKARPKIVKKVERSAPFSYKFTFDLASQSVVSAYLAEASGKREKVYELFTGRFMVPGSSDQARIDFADCFKKYGITEKPEGRENAVVSGEKLSRYSLLVTVKPVAFEETLTIGLPGRAPGLLSSPRGLCCDQNGYLYVADYGNDRIQKFDRDGNFIFEFGSFAWDEKNTSGNNVGTSQAATFNEPIGVAVTGKNIFVSERGNNRIQKFDRDGNFLLIFGGEGKTHGRMNAPMGVTCDSSNYVWVCDSKNDRIQKFDQNGNYMLEIGGFGYGSGKFNEPTDIAIDSRNNIYVLDARNKRISSYDEYGNLISETPLAGVEGLREVSGIGIFLDKMVLVSVGLADAGSRLAAFSLEGKFLGFVGGACEKLSGIAVSRDGEIFVSDSDRNRIVRFSLAGTEAGHHINLTEFVND